MGVLCAKLCSTVIIKRFVKYGFFFFFFDPSNSFVINFNRVGSLQTKL